jgi:phosphomannomutase
VVEVLNLLWRRGESLSTTIEPLRRYAKSLEINFEVEDKAGKIQELAERFGDGRIDYLDGITVVYPEWWFNVRPSNTEPYLRLVLEAGSSDDLDRRREQLQSILGTPVG